MHRAARYVAAFWRKCYEDGLTGLAAMVAYNLLLSIFPLALIALFVAGRVLRSPELAASVINDARTIFPTAAQSTLVEGVRRLQRETIRSRSGAPSGPTTGRPPLVSDSHSHVTFRQRRGFCLAR